MRKIRGTATLKTDMLFLLIAVSYMLLASVSFDEQEEPPVSTVEQGQEDKERTKLFVSPHGTFEVMRNDERGNKVDLRTFAQSKTEAGVEIHPAHDVMWKDIQVVYVFLSRNGVDVTIKPYSGGI